MAKKEKAELDLSDIGRTSRAIAFLTVLMFFCVVLFSFIMSWRLESSAIMIVLIPSAAGAYVIVERACFRRSETVDVVKLQVKYSKNFNPEQITNVVDVVNKHPLGSDTTGVSDGFGSGVSMDNMTEIYDEEAAQ